MKLVQEQPVSDALEVSACVPACHNLPRLTGIGASVEKHLIPNERASENGPLEFFRDALHAIQLLDRQVDQNGLE
jgi:hypothetical protein